MNQIEKVFVFYTAGVTESWLLHKLLRKRLLSILFWSVIAAAFIGPGTLVTASTAGAKFGLSLAWALVFATVACIVFQEMAARLTLVTGYDLSETIRRFEGRRWLFIIPLGVILGCVAYEAGNLLGASLGLHEMLGIDRTWAIVLIVALAALPLLMSSLRWIATILGGMVAIMGIAFLYVAMTVDFSVSGLAMGMFVPSVPAGSDWVILGLIGTTVVPYNLFLGSGISGQESLGEMRVGLILSVVLGGVVSLAILITGTVMIRDGGLAELIEVTGSRLGQDMQKLIALGLFAAGFTSAVTAPLAAGLIVRGMLPERNMTVVRSVSLGVLLIGGMAGILEYTPELIILAAQGLNGLILPLAAILLWYLTNQSQYMGELVTSKGMNVLAFLITTVLITLGIRNILVSLGSVTDKDLLVSPWVILLASVPATGLIAWRILGTRNG